MRIIVVDDHVLFRDGIVGLLKDQPDFKVVGEAGTMRESIELTRLLQPDLVLMDFELPDGTGLDATQAILMEKSDCKIIFLTIHDEDANLFAAIRSGAVGYLLKNVPIRSLLASLRSVERGEAAISREATSRLLREFSHTQPISANIDDPLAPLSRREIEILGQLSTGASNQQIADHLFLSIYTVKHHVRNILSKLNVRNRMEAARFAERHNIKPKS